jgi:hypothetical protein
MIKLMTLAAVAAIAVAAPASASEIRVSLTGKSAEQINTEIRVAAHTVCMRDTASDPLFHSAYGSCVRATLKAAKDKLQDLAAADGEKLAQR